MLNTALLISTDSGNHDDLAEVSHLLGQQAIQINYATEATASEQLSAYIERGIQPDLVIFSPRLNRPIELARKLRALLSFAHLLFLANSDNETPLKRQLSLAPMIGTHWSLGRVDDENLGGLVAESIRSANQRRRLRTTLDRINLQISRPSTTEASSYRKLVLSDRYLRSVLDQAQDAIIGADTQGTVTSLNRAAAVLCNCKESDAVGRSLLKLCGGDWESRLTEIISTLHSGGTATSEEVACMRSDNSVFFVELSAGFVTDDLNRPIGMSVIARDITRRKQTEEQAHLSSQRLQAIFRQATVGIAQIDLEGRFMEVNDRYCEIVGRSAEELQALRMQDITEPEDLAANLDMLNALAVEGTPFSLNKRYVRPDGSHVWVNNNVSAVKDSSGQPTSFVAVSVDITDKLKAEDDQLHAAAEREKLLESERVARASAERASHMKDEFLATLSHELRTPLNAILGWSQIIKGDPNSGNDIKQGIEVIERNARTQAQIIEDLLDMSRIISGKVRLDVQRFDLAAAVQAAVETSLPTAKAKSIRLISVIDPLNGLSVSGDINRIQQVLWNLLSNAIKFTPKGGKIQVLLERVNSHVEISVIDNGEGIKPEFLPYVFDRFRQEDASTTRRHGGLGLGLSIVKQLVELHGGSVRVKSGGQGQGTTFVVALPLTVMHLDPFEEQERRHPRVKATEGSAGEPCVHVAGLHVLVVDDEPDARALVKRLLEDCNATAVVAGSAQEAINRIQEESFDAIISDVGMPGEDGYSLIRRIRSLESEEKRSIPAIALTAYARTEDRIKAVSAGFLMHVAKPVEPVELITMLAAATGRTSQG